MHHRMFDREVRGRAIPAGTSMEGTKQYVWVGYDFERFVTSYLLFGNSSTRIGTSSSESDTEYGVGVLFNLLNREVMDPILGRNLVFNIIRVNGGIEYTSSGGSFHHNNLEWRELYISLTLSLVNELTGETFFVPDSVGIFGGPVYSHYHGADLEEEDSIGYSAGLELYFSEKMSVYLGLHSLGTAGNMAGLRMRF
ncbi:MAG: hypothetical protein R6V03_03580 [Kiritimatiellia bacterium]